MNQERNALRAGIFIVGSVALIVVVIVGIKGLDRIVEPMQSREVRFSLKDDVGGLRVGDDVRIGGYKVGVVKDIELIGEGIGGGHDHILVRFSMPRKYVVRHEPHIAIQGTLTGTSWLNFEDLGTGEALAESTQLTGRPSRSSELMSQLAALAPQIQDLINDVRTQTLPTANQTLLKFGKTADTWNQTGASGTALLQEVHGQIDPIVQKYHQVADRAVEMMTQVRDLLGDTKIDIRTTIANLRATTGALKEKLPRLLDQLDGIFTKVDKSVDSIRNSLQDVQTTIANARDISAAARSVIVGNKGKLDAMIAALKATSDNVKGASAEIRRSPWRLLYKPAPNEMGNLNLYDSARQFADGASDLSDAATALRDAMQSSQLDKAQVQQLMDRVEKSFGQFHEVEQKLWKAVKE